MDKEQNDLVDQQSNQEGQPCRDRYVSSVQPVLIDPPLQSYPQNDAGDTEIRYADHERIQEAVASGEAVDAAGDQDIEIVHVVGRL